MSEHDDWHGEEDGHQQMIDDYEHWLHGLYYGRDDNAPTTDHLRIKYIHHGCYIKHPNGEYVSNEIEGLMLAQPTGFFGHIALIGVEGAGKTIAHKVVKNGIGRSYTDDNINTQMGVWRVDMPNELSERKFLMSIIDSFCLPYEYHDTTVKLRRSVISIIRELNVKVLVIENTDVLLDGWPNDVKKMMAVLKHLTDFTDVSLVFVATPTVYDRVMKFESTDLVLREVIVKELDNNKVFRKFLKSYERFLPLAKPSNLASTEVSNAIYDKTKGNIGAIDTLLKALAMRAVNSGDDFISIEQINGFDLS